MKCCKYVPKSALHAMKSPWKWQRRTQGPYSQHLIFFWTYEKGQKARTLNYTRLKRLPSDKHSSLFGAFICKIRKNEVFWIRSQIPYEPKRRFEIYTVLRKIVRNLANILSNIFQTSNVSILFFFCEIALYKLKNPLLETWET